MSQTQNEIVTPVPTDEQRPDLYLYAILFLGAMGVIALVSFLTLAVMQREIPDGIAALGGVAVGALAGMLAPGK